MINHISSWAGSIVVAVITVTILEMLLPDGKNKKYIKTVMGVYLLLIIVSPIIKAVSGQDIDLENLIEIEDSNISINNISIQTNSSIENIYLTNIKKDIKAKLEQKGYDATVIDLIIETADQDNYGTIYEMNIILMKNENESMENKSVSKIETVEISIGDTGLKKELSNEETITDIERQDIIEFLSTTYNVEKSKITIRRD